jgi:drug/metabolite transporter (DMT)-like permease
MIVVFSLIAAVSYGAADFLGGLTTKQTAALAVTAISQSVGLVLLLLAVPFFPGAFHASDYGWGALAGLCGAIGIALLYHALSIGKMGVVSPVTAVIGAAIPVVVSSVLGQHLLVSQLAGIGCALVAIVLISASFENGVREISTRGLKEAFASGLCLGGFYVFLAQAHHDAGLHNLLAARVTSVVCLIAIGAMLRVDLRPTRTTLPALVAVGALDMSANILYVLATFHGALAIAAVLTSLYPASTVFLALVVLRERLSLVQWSGVGCALAGVVLIARCL